jgi:hypothetical protein
MSAATDDHRGLFTALVGDGRPLLSLTGLLLIGFGLFALFLSATGQFLPHDVAYLGMTPGQLCAVNECRVVHFMFHDRVSFGSTLIAIGTLYLWLAAFPLRAGQPWAWWLFVVSGALGFASFLLYLGYGYLDTWHGVGTRKVWALTLFFSSGAAITKGESGQGVITTLPRTTPAVEEPRPCHAILRTRHPPSPTRMSGSAVPNRPGATPSRGSANRPPGGASGTASAWTNRPPFTTWASRPTPARTGTTPTATRWRRS